MAKGEPNRKRKVIAVDQSVLHALDQLACDSDVGLDTLADEAFRDLLKKHRRPVTLKQALRESARTIAANDPAPRSKRKRSSTV